jgi:hypothetical protein
MPKRPELGAVRWVNIANVLERQTEIEIAAIRDALEAVEDLTAEQVEARVRRVREETVSDRANRVRDFGESWFGILFVGPATAEGWNRAKDVLTQDETERKAKLRKGHTKETAPEMYKSGLTPEGEKAQQELNKTVLGEAFGGWLEEPDEDPDVASKPPEGMGWEHAWSELMYLTRTERIALMREAVDAQSMSREDFFRPEDPRDVGSEDVQPDDGGDTGGTASYGEAAG